MKTDQLRNEIEATFSFVKKPSGIALSFHKDDCFQCQSLRDDLAETSGERLPREAIRHIHQDMSCLSAEGWRWALPSYLRYCLASEASSCELETEFLIYNLAPEPKYRAETIERLSALSSEQLLCLTHFLEWCQTHEYWSQYCPDQISSGIDFLSSLKRKREALKQNFCG